MKKKLKSCLDYMIDCWIAILIYSLFMIWIFFRDKINRFDFDFGFSTAYVFILPIFGIALIIFQISSLREKKIKAKEEISKLFKELINYLFFWTICCIFTTIWQLTILSGGVSENQSLAKQSLLQNPITELLLTVILAPIVEESLFRAVPRMFLKNNRAYIIITGFLFAYAHCISSPNALLYLPMYLPNAIYLAYIYTKTDDILVPMMIHSCTNLIACILIFTTV